MSIRSSGLCSRCSMSRVSFSPFSFRLLSLQRGPVFDDCCGKFLRWPSTTDWKVLPLSQRALDYEPNCPVPTWKNWRSNAPSLEFKIIFFPEQGKLISKQIRQQWNYGVVSYCVPAQLTAMVLQVITIPHYLNFWNCKYSCGIIEINKSYAFV